MATLHLERAEYERVTAAADGGVLVELTDQGAQRLVDRAARYAAALEERADRRQAWLRSLTTQELVALATSRFGGPEPDVAAEGVRRMREMVDKLQPDVAAEGVRRMREMVDKLQPALAAMRALGLVGGGQ